MAVDGFPGVYAGEGEFIGGDAEDRACVEGLIRWCCELRDVGVVWVYRGFCVVRISGGGSDRL